MARNKPHTDNFADLVARLKEMSNMTPEQERTELMEAASAEPKMLDGKDVSLADIAKLAGIKEYTEAPKVSKKAEKLVESITAETKYCQTGLFYNHSDFWIVMATVSTRKNDTIAYRYKI